MAATENPSGDSEEAIQVGDDKDDKSPTEAEKVGTTQGNNSESVLGSRSRRTSRMILEGGKEEKYRRQRQGLQTEPTVTLLLGRLEL